MTNQYNVAKDLFLMALTSLRVPLTPSSDIDLRSRGSAHIFNHFYSAVGIYKRKQDSKNKRKHACSRW